MVGLGEGWIVAAYILSIASAVLCVVYGIINWNKKAEADAPPDAEAGEWPERRD